MSKFFEFVFAAESVGLVRQLFSVNDFDWFVTTSIAGTTAGKVGGKTLINIIGRSEIVTPVFTN